MTVQTRPSPLARLGGAIRDSWLVLGLTLVFFLVLEGGWRLLKPVVRPTRATVDSTLFPYHGVPWFEEYRRDENAGENRFDPYRTHWPDPVATRYVNIDSAGRRVTPQPRPDGARPRLVYLLGGSAMWGVDARDSATIPALTAAALRARGITDVEVVNLGQRAYNTTQEAITLQLELAAGRVPAAAVFYNGFNDVRAAQRLGAPGRTLSEVQTAAVLARGRAGFWASLFGVGRHSALVTDLLAAAGWTEFPERAAESTRVCEAAAAWYRRTALGVEGLGRTWGFPVLYVLQPVRDASAKPLSAWEKTAVPKRAGVDSCYAAITAAMADRAGTTFHSLTGLFDGDTGTIFVDNVHITEAANGVVAGRLADLLQPLLSPPPDTTGPRSSRR